MKLFTKLLTIALSLLAGLAGARISGAVWKRATGEQPPAVTNPESQQRTKIGKVLAFAVFSGATASVVQAVTKRWTQNLIEKKRTP
ncbi:DUF4235 domain-containing protein [Paeniglutamicibacter sp. MACA_103]|uniref:DUF4235 domain-containing protein n=1 Tax=Paeniglutamicibacter sp. MACA_103 TaxID=3377337 RepID=UPI0038935B39